jgi:hypothetical protein
MARLFFDMDGVLTDFDLQFNRWFGAAVEVARYSSDAATRHTIDKHLTNAPAEFWADMPWMPGAEEAWVEFSSRDPLILSKPHYAAACIAGKRTWVARNLGAHVPLFLAADKSEYGTVRDLLVDDTPENSRRWPGRFVLHKNWETTRKEIGLFPYLVEYHI